MRLLFLFVITFFFSTWSLEGQSENNLSDNTIAGITELREDIFKRQELYVDNLNRIIISLDSSNIKTAQKKLIQDYIQVDIQSGATANSLERYDALPKESPFKNIYIENYIATNQDFQIDKDLIAALIREGILTAEKKVNPSKVEELIQDFQFLDIKDNDRVLLHNAMDGLYAMLLGYCHEQIDLTIRHIDLYKRYLVLDRMDRYPNVNNGNLIEFLLEESPSVKVKSQKWDKIIIRNIRALEVAPASLLNSLHDHLSDDGHVYILHRVKNKSSNCEGSLSESNLLKRVNRFEFELVDSLEVKCLTYYKFKSTKRNN